MSHFDDANLNIFLDDAISPCAESHLRRETDLIVFFLGPRFFATRLLCSHASWMRFASSVFDILAICAITFAIYSEDQGKLTPRAGYAVDLSNGGLIAATAEK